MNALTLYSHIIPDLFEDFFSPSWFSYTNTPFFITYKEGNDAVLKADVPGLKKEQLKVEVNDGHLLVSGSNKEEKNKYVREYSFCKSFSLPDYYEGTPEAKLEEGVLYITFKDYYKEIEKKKEVLEIPIK